MTKKERAKLRRQRRNRRIALTAAAFVLVTVFAIGGTIAWLTDSTESLTNTFTVGDINIALDETTSEYKMVPGNTIAKDPTVTVEKDSEACYLFVKIEESDNFRTFLDYDIADGWTSLSGKTGVYYREVAATTKDETFQVLAGDTDNKTGIVTVDDEVTKAQLGVLTEETYPTLTFTAYACQKDNVADAAAAWALLNPAA